MRLSKNAVRVIANFELERRGVIEFKPRAFGNNVQKAAKEFLLGREQAATEGGGFILNPLLADQTGIADVERGEIERRLELEALERLKTLQESAYKEAFELGKEEGRQAAYAEAATEIEDVIAEIKTVAEGIRSLQPSMIAANEARIISLVNAIASRIAMKAVEEDPERIRHVLQECSQGIDPEESVTIRLNPDDRSLIENLMKNNDKTWNFLEAAKFVENPDIAKGGCIIETNYGTVDATLKERVDRAWSALAERMPRVKESFET